MGTILANFKFEMHLNNSVYLSFHLFACASVSVVNILPFAEINISPTKLAK